MSAAEALARLRRGCVECHTEEDLERKLASGRPLCVKLGVDPTSPDLHLGHTVVLNRLRAFQDLGHTAVLIIGDFTARIGDPSGRDATRPALKAEEIKKNADTYKEQAFKVLDKSRTQLRYNSEWLEPFVQKDLLPVLRRYTVGQLLQREDFAERTSKNLPITLLEILYPIFQGYDSVAIQADVELGGSDQLFNLLMGRSLQKDFGQEPQAALTFPLLVGTDGIRKMSKSYGNAIALNDGPRDLFGKLMRISDELMLDYYELLTDTDLFKVRKAHPMEAKKELAGQITARYHGAEAARAELEFFEKTFSQKAVPQDMPVSKHIRIRAPSKGGDGDKAYTTWSRMLAAEALVASRKEAQRLIAQGAFKIDGSAVKEDEISLDAAEKVMGRECTLQIGKHKFHKVKFIG